ncbi:MAG: hypothetical protein PHH60_00685 [Candidatus Margulisbacteria bacterium]|nr:hypothetical protein [Candidatus Margulisiibacteriota bacterium]
MPSIKYALPNFLIGKCTEKEYLRWLYAKARAHVLRDRKRSNDWIAGEQYRLAIHRAVVNSNGLDVYTGKILRWDLISKYDNNKAKLGGRAYKKKFADLPTIDHINDVKGKLEFNICSWRVNGAKSDLTLNEFIELCGEILHFNAR